MPEFDSTEVGCERLNPFTARAHSHNWQGGTITADGYVLIYVGKHHHLADVRGYACEHRLVAERMLGRRLEPGELVHHKDKSKAGRSDNRPDNLEVVQGNAGHFVLHRKHDSGLRRPGEPNPVVACACGCGNSFPKYDDCGRPRRYVSGHNRPQRSLRDDMLWYLENVPKPKTSVYIASFYDLSVRQVANAMTALRRAGKIYVKNRYWRRNYDGTV